MSEILVEGLTKDFGGGAGIFDINLRVGEGEVFGFLGPNGAGKTTTIRHLMGFLHPTRGRAEISGMDCFSQRAQIQENVGHLPGEVAMMDDMRADAYLCLVAQMRHMRSLTRMRELIDRFELDPTRKIKRMSKGMKQKVGIVAAFMHSPKVLLLDEPTSGLDPLMQERFLELVAEEQAAGRTILLSSHIFEEIERACTRIAFIREGRIIDDQSMTSLRAHRATIARIHFDSPLTYQRFISEHPEFAHNLTPPGTSSSDTTDQAFLQLTLRGDINPFLRALSRYNVTSIQMRPPSLEELFLTHYSQRGKQSQEAE